MKEVICRQEMGGGLFLHMIYEPIQELVRCKDCKYAPGNDKGYTCKIRDILGIYMKNPDYFFCADGTLKDS